MGYLSMYINRELELMLNTIAKEIGADRVTTIKILIRYVFENCIVARKCPDFPPKS